MITVIPVNNSLNRSEKIAINRGSSNSGKEIKDAPLSTKKAQAQRWFTQPFGTMLYFFVWHYVL